MLKQANVLNRPAQRRNYIPLKEYVMKTDLQQANVITKLTTAVKFILIFGRDFLYESLP